MRRLLLLLASGACTIEPTVPDELLTDVPTEVVGRLEPLQVEARELQAKIAAAEVATAQARAGAQAESQRLEATWKALEADRELKKLAVVRGDTPGAGLADARIGSHLDRIAASESAVTALTAHADVTRAELALYRAELAWANARIQLERAVALSGEHDLRLPRFERAAEAARARRDEAGQEVERARAHARTLDGA